MRVRRIGSMTLGVGLLVFGALFLAHTIWEGVSYSLIFRFWPCLLISLGLEVIWSLRCEEGKWIYDKAAIALMFLITFFAMSMAAVQFFMEWAWEFGTVYW